MAASGRKRHARRWDRWVKLVAVVLTTGILIFNFSMVSTVWQAAPRGPAAPDEANARLRSVSSADTTPVPSNARHLTDRPWFLQPEKYMEKDGCDFAGAVELFDPSQLEINCDNIHQLALGKKLGQGFWREVFEAEWQGRSVAVKRVKQKLLDRVDIIPRHVQEAAVMFPIRHDPNIVGLVGWCNTTVVVEFVPVPLDAYIYNPSNEISVERSLEIARDAARGLQQLHAARGGPFAHTDIQTRQFLMDAHGRVLLNDFNRVKYTGPRRLTEPSATPGKCVFRTPVAKGKWRSPEEYLKKPNLDEKLDIYSLSLVLWSLQSRRKPFEDISRDQVYADVPQGRRPPVDAMQAYPQAMQELIVECWHTDPLKRPSAAALADRIEVILNEYRRTHA